jgi:predicted transcriptional regulator
VRLGNTPFGILSGIVTIGSYDTAHPEVVAITKKFKVVPHVTVSGVSSLIYLVRWDATTKSFIAYLASGASGALVEASASDNVGIVQFHAIGQLG